MPDSRTCPPTPRSRWRSTRTSRATSTRRSIRFWPSFPFGDRTIEELIAEQFAGADSDVDFEQDVKPVLGNPAVVGAIDVASFLGAGNDESFVAALQTDDQDALDNLIEKSGARETGETAGATKYEDGGSVFAVDGDMVVLANSEQSLDRALERADGDERLSQDHFEAAFEGYPNAAWPASTRTSRT